MFNFLIALLATFTFSVTPTHGPAPLDVEIVFHFEAPFTGTICYQIGEKDTEGVESPVTGPMCEEEIDVTEVTATNTGKVPGTYFFHAVAFPEEGEPQVADVVTVVVEKPGKIAN